MNPDLAFLLAGQRTQPGLKPGFAGIERRLPIIFENGYAGRDGGMIEAALPRNFGLFIV